MMQDKVESRRLMAQVVGHGFAMYTISMFVMQKPCQFGLKVVLLSLLFLSYMNALSPSLENQNNALNLDYLKKSFLF